MMTETIRVLITGASGFLGRYLIRDAPPQARLFLQYRTHRPQTFEKKATLLPVDFSTTDWQWWDQVRPQVVIHTAALASLDDCERQPEFAKTMNLDATRRLAERAERSDARFLFTSTDIVFDGRKGHYREEDPPAPLNVYGRTKAEAEAYLLAHHSDTVVVRPALFYGKSLNGRRSFTEIMFQKLRQGEPVKLFTDEYRTPLLVNDLSRALWELAFHDYRGILHLGGSPRLSRYDLGVLLCEMFDFDRTLLVPTLSRQTRFVARRPLDVSLDSSRARRILRTPLHDCTDGLKLAFGKE